MSFMIVDKVEDKYGIKDTQDGVVEYYDLEEISRILSLGIKISGVYKLDDKIIIKNYDIMKSSLAKQKFLGKKVINLTEVIHNGSINNISLLGIEETDDVIVFNSTDAKSSSGLFKNLKVNSLDLSYFDTSKIENMSMMFFGCETNKLIFGDFDTSNVFSMVHMFAHSNIKNLDLSSFRTPNLEWANGMFLCTRIDHLDISHFDTRNCLDMNNIFDGIRAKTINLGDFDISKVKDKSIIFFLCNAEITTTNKEVLELLNKKVILLERV